MIILMTLVNLSACKSSKKASKSADTTTTQAPKLSEEAIVGTFESNKGVKTTLSCFCYNSGILQTDKGESINICLPNDNMFVDCETAVRMKGSYDSITIEEDEAGNCRAGTLKFFIVNQQPQCLHNNHALGGGKLHGKAANKQQKISVKAGETFTIEQAANPSTGYQWQIQSGITDENIIKFEQQNYKATIPTNGEAMVGSGGTSTFTFRALQAGTTKLKLIYTRSSNPTQITQFANYIVEVK